MLDLPHKYPIKFAKHIISKSLNEAKVYVEFLDVPSLAMLIEASAQSSASLSDASTKKGYLVSLKNIQLLYSPTKTNFEVQVVHQNTLSNMKSISFNVFENQKSIVIGSFVITYSWFISWWYEC